MRARDFYCLQAPNSHGRTCDLFAGLFRLSADVVCPTELFNGVRRDPCFVFEDVSNAGLRDCVAPPFYSKLTSNVGRQRYRFTFLRVVTYELSCFYIMVIGGVVAGLRAGACVLARRFRPPSFVLYDAKGRPSNFDAGDGRENHFIAGRLGVLFLIGLVQFRIKGLLRFAIQRHLSRRDGRVGRPRAANYDNVFR